MHIINTKIGITTMAIATTYSTFTRRIFRNELVDHWNPLWIFM